MKCRVFVRHFILLRNVLSIKKPAEVGASRLSVVFITSYIILIFIHHNMVEKKTEVGQSSGCDTRRSCIFSAVFILAF